MKHIIYINDFSRKSFNQLNPLQAIWTYDALLAVDEAQGSHAIRARLSRKLGDKVTLSLKRPRKIQISLVKGGSLGLQLDCTPSEIGGVVKDIMPHGLTAQWNKEHPSKALNPGDRILEIGGEEFIGSELLDQIRSSKKLFLTVLKY